MTADVTYAPDRIGYRYGVPDDAYTKGYHRGQDVRELNVDQTASVVTQVDAIDGGVVVYVGIPNHLLRLTIVIDTGRTEGRYESHSHLADDIVQVGQRVTSGQRLARNADMDESPGLVTAPHDHITITDYPDGAWETSRNEYDPLPFIQAAHDRAIRARNEGDDDMTKLIRWNGVHVFAIGRESVYHVPTMTEAGTQEALFGRAQDIDNDGLTAILRANGIPWNAVDAVLKGTAFEATGGYWSRLTAEGEAIRSGQSASEKTLDDVLATVAKIAAP